MSATGSGPSPPRPAIATPAARAPQPEVVVLGAGIAGLTAAHELAERGFTVTVCEPRRDERVELESAPADRYPPVKLGGLAASQFSTVQVVGPGPARLRPFPGRPGRPRPPAGIVPGEHGFRFFPAYYLHVWDLLQRIPLSEQTPSGRRPGARTVMDNVRRVVTQATTVDGKPSLVFPRETPRSGAEMMSVLGQLHDFGYTVPDVQTFAGRMLRYLATSPQRRAAELQNLSAFDFFVGRDAATPRRFSYTPGFEKIILDMPKVLAAFDSHWGDARTNLTTYLQLQLQMDRRDDKADGVLNGPTTVAWFDHWYRHLVTLGVRFVGHGAERLDPPAPAPGLPPHRRGRVSVTLTDGTRLAPDYLVVAVDAPAAERITAPLRASGTGGAVAGLDGFTTSPPPPTAPLEPSHTRPVGRRDPMNMDELGRVSWDRFQTLAGVQFYFDTEFQLVRGHVYYSGTDWGLSSINQHGLWEQRPVLATDGFASVLSVDIGDMNGPSEHLGKAARDCTADELAGEVWRQIVAALTSDLDADATSVLPWPAWYAIDRNLVLADGPGPADGRPLRNEAPYLVPIVGDWDNRPGAEPWDPGVPAAGPPLTDEQWRDDLEHRHVWQARHGGYQVHHNSLVFAGTWNRTFTRMTSMEAACESGRHAVNAVLDHDVWVQSDGTDPRGTTTLDWKVPFGFLDQGFSSPVRLPTPAGDYCFVFDVENREPFDVRPLRDLDARCFRDGLPHPFDLLDPGGIAMTVPPGATPDDYTGQLLGHLQAWRQHLEQVASGPTPTWSWPGASGAPSWSSTPGGAPAAGPSAPAAAEPVGSPARAATPPAGAPAPTDAAPAGTSPGATGTAGTGPASLYRPELADPPGTPPAAAGRTASAFPWAVEPPAGRGPAADPRSG